MHMLRTLLVDDEPLALSRLERLLSAHRDRIALIGSATDGPEAIRMIAAAKPDLVFLDIHLGEMNGFEALDCVDSRPLVIFTTAYDQYALRAFETNAVDYLLKPVDPDRLAKAIDKLARLRGDRDRADRSLQTLLDSLRPPEPQRIAVKLGNRVKLLDPDDIFYFQAGDKYVEAVTAEGRHLIGQSLAKLEGSPACRHFVRAHRSVLVNAQFIDEIGKSAQHGLYISLKDPGRTRLPLSRQGKLKLGVL